MQSSASATDTVIPIGYKTRIDDKLRLVLDRMPVGITWANLEDGTVAFANRRFTDLTGYTLEDIPNIGVFYRKAFDDPADFAAAHAASKEIFGHHPVEVQEFPELEISIRCKDGSHKVVALGLVVLPEVGWIVGTYLDLTDRKEHERLIRRLAEEDPLTGLLNRRSFEAAVLAEFEKRTPPESVVMAVLDLDGFKTVNDRHGHEVGDRVLKMAAERLSGVFRRDDTLARVGGDEFGAILVTENGKRDIVALLGRIREAFATPFDIDGKPIRVGISVGVARHPEDAGTPLALYNAADQAMYRDKFRHAARPEAAL